VISKHEGKAAFVDLQPLFERVRQMYFTTEQNYRKARDSGPDPRQWPYAFDADSTWNPTIVTVLEVPRTTAVIASMSGGDRARASVASENGKVIVTAHSTDYHGVERLRFSTVC
jgi:hypothetical protein